MPNPQVPQGGQATMTGQGSPQPSLVAPGEGNWFISFGGSVIASNVTPFSANGWRVTSSVSSAIIGQGGTSITPPTSQLTVFAPMGATIEAGLEVGYCVDATISGQWAFPFVFYLATFDVVSGTGGGGGAGNPDFLIAISMPAIILPSQLLEGGEIEGTQVGVEIVTVTSLNGYNAATTLSLSNLPPNVDSEFLVTQPPPADLVKEWPTAIVTPAPNASVSCVLMLSSTKTVPPGIYLVTLTGTSPGGLTHTATFNLIIEGAVDMATIPQARFSPVGVQAITIYPWNGNTGPYDATTGETLEGLQTLGVSEAHTTVEGTGGETVDPLFACEVARRVEVKCAALRVSLRMFNLIRGGNLVIDPADAQGGEVQVLTDQKPDRAPYFRMVGQSNVNDGTVILTFCKCKITGTVAYNFEREQIVIPDFSCICVYDGSYVRKDGLPNGATWEMFYGDGLSPATTGTHS